MPKCDMGDCKTAPAWRVRPIEGTPSFVRDEALKIGTPVCDEHLADACYFTRGLSATDELIVVRTNK